MFPGKIDPRMMRQAMKKMGIEETEVPNVQEVIIRCSDKEIVIQPASVSKVSGMGNLNWQVQGTAKERALETKASISEEDVQTVMEQAGVDEDTARKAIETAGGDLAAAIMNLEDKKE
ncbi:MAG: nascent polypeptide-associated complex protein [Nanoarchaeota archaeon]